MEKLSICPWWAGNIFKCGARKMLHSPRRILEPYLRAGMTVMDVGCAMGYFTIPMAEMVGESGRVIAVDVQEKMLDGMLLTAEKAGVARRVAPHLCEPETLGIEDYAGTVDFALAFMMVHEVPDRDGLIRDIYAALRDSGLLLFAEPVGHVSEVAYLDSLRGFEGRGFTVESAPRVALCRAALLKK